MQCAQHSILFFQSGSKIKVPVSSLELRGGGCAAAPAAMPAARSGSAAANSLWCCDTCDTCNNLCCSTTTMPALTWNMPGEVLAATCSGFAAAALLYTCHRNCHRERSSGSEQLNTRWPPPDVVAALMPPACKVIAGAAGDADVKPYIQVLRDGTPEAACDSNLSAWYDRVRNPDGTLDNIMSIHSLNPATLESHAALYTQVRARTPQQFLCIAHAPCMAQCMKGSSPLCRVDREVVAIASSMMNRCRY